MTVIINKDGYEFLECISLNEQELNHYSPLSGSYAVVRFDSKYLETGRVVKDMEFRGLLKVRKPDGAIKYNPIYYAELDNVMPFKENSETDQILFWSLIDNVGYIDEVDEAVLRWCESLS